METSHPHIPESQPRRAWVLSVAGATLAALALAGGFLAVTLTDAGRRAALDAAQPADFAARTAAALEAVEALGEDADVLALSQGMSVKEDAQARLAAHHKRSAGLELVAVVSFQGRVLASHPEGAAVPDDLVRDVVALGTDTGADLPSARFRRIGAGVAALVPLRAPGTKSAALGAVVAVAPAPVGLRAPADETRRVQNALVEYAALALFCFLAALTVAGVVSRKHAAVLATLRESALKLQRDRDDAERRAKAAMELELAQRLHDARKETALRACELFKALPAAAPAVVQAAERVEADLRELTGERPLQAAQPVAPEALIVASLEAVFRERATADVIISYELDHTHMALVDAGRAQKATQRLVEHAAAALRDKGRIWLRTRQYDRDGARWLALSVGYASPLPPKVGGDPFRTLLDGDAGGSFALAVAKKAAEAHGGSATAQTSVEHGTELTLVLPVAGSHLSPGAGPLPNHSQVLYRRAAGGGGVRGDLGVDRARDDLHAADELLIGMARKLGRPVRILCVDPDPRYAQVAEAQILRAKEAREHAVVKGAADAVAARNALEDHKPDIVLADPASGVPLDALREWAPRALVCAHVDPAVAPSPHALGADYVVSKPLTREKLELLYKEADLKLLKRLQLKLPSAG